jgi:MFS family permease
VYKWIVLVHVLSVLGFVLLHGASAIVFLRLKRESDPDRIKALLSLSAFPANASWISLGMLLISGIALGFMGHWWAWGWIWASLVVLILMVLAMGFMGSRALNSLRADLGLHLRMGTCRRNRKTCSI